MKKIMTVLSLVALVSCGKGEPIGDAINIAEDLVQDATSTVGKAIQDTYNEGDRTSNKIITDANDVKNEVLSNTGNFTEAVGDVGESLGQAPRKIGNGLLGTNQDTDDDLNSTEQDLANTQKELEELKKQVDEMYQDILVRFGESSGEINDLKGDLSDLGDTVDQNQADMVAALDAEHTAVLDQINKLKRKDRKTLAKVRRLKNRLRNLRQTVREVKRDLNNLEIFCETYTRRFHSTPFITSVHVQCEIESERRDRER